MNSNKNYQMGLLYLVHLLINADGVIDDKERSGLRKVQALEHIPDALFQEFEKEIMAKKEREIYQAGIEMINECSDEEKLNAFVHLYKMSEADGRVHVKEVRLLLYSIRMAGIEFADVVERAAKLKPYYP
jgi:uncharacterized tellurite resistance protein B-like protein